MPLEGYPPVSALCQMNKPRTYRYTVLLRSPLGCTQFVVFCLSILNSRWSQLKIIESTHSKHYQLTKRKTGDISTCKNSAAFCSHWAFGRRWPCWQSLGFSRHGDVFDVPLACLEEVFCDVSSFMFLLKLIHSYLSNGRPLFARTLCLVFPYFLQCCPNSECADPTFDPCNPTINVRMRRGAKGATFPRVAMVFRRGARSLQTAVTHDVNMYLNRFVL